MKTRKVPVMTTDEEAEAFLDPKIWTGLYWILEQRSGGITWPTAKD